MPTAEQEQVAAVQVHRAHAATVPQVNQTLAATVPQADRAPVTQHHHVVAPPARDNDTAATYEIPTTWQERGPIVERAGNHTATRGNRATAAIEGGEVPAAVARNPQPSGVPEQAQGHCGQYSKNPKSTIQAKVWHISFYPLLWTQLLETAKAEMQCALFCQHPFLPDKQTTVEGECYEVLLNVIARYKKEQMPVKHGMVCSLTRTRANGFLGFSERKHDMSILVTCFQPILRANH